MKRDPIDNCSRKLKVCLLVLTAVWIMGNTLSGQIAVKGDMVFTMASGPIESGVVVVTDGRISAVGPADNVMIPEGFEVYEAAIVTPGLLDAHTVVGMAGYLNQDHDQEQLENSSPVQPELRAIDAYNPDERLISWFRSFGVTTIHSGHAPGNLISGQTLLAKTRGKTVSEAVFSPSVMVAATLGPGAIERGKAPGTRSKAVAILRTRLLEAREYLEKTEDDEEGKRPARSLEKEELVRVLRKEIPILLTVNRANDIEAALRVAKEFQFNLVLDSVAEAYLVLDQIKDSGFPIILHPSMKRAYGETENLSFETASVLQKAGIPFALQSGYESYVPRTRVVLLEAAVAAANGLSMQEALAAITISPARILGIEDRVGSLEVGKDGDLVLFDGDPFEYSSHVQAVFIEGELVSRGDQEWR